MVLFWVARYWHSSHFGLYEDDLTIIPTAFNLTFSELTQFIGAYATRFQGQGRPLHHILISSFSWLGWQIADLWGPYLLGYMLTALNIALFYLLLKRIFDSYFAFLGGLFYVIYAADTTQPYLTHSLGLQPALLLFLLACHSYLSNKRILAYILIFVSTFVYETPFLLFLAVPLVGIARGKQLFMEYIWHGLIVGSMLAVIYILRALYGEGRVSSLGLKDILVTPFLHMLQGPLVSLGTFVYRPIQALQAPDPEIGLAIALSFTVFLLVLSRFQIHARVDLKDLWRAIKDPSARRALPNELKLLGRMIAAGAVMLVMAYPLTFTVRAYAISGRDTRVHAAGVVGAAVLLAAGALLLLYLANAHRCWRYLARAIIALELALMVGYGFVIQRDYVNAWQYQRQFWTELIPLIPDAGEGTMILVDPDALQDTRQIGANYWNLPRVLYQLYVFPEDVKNVPIVHRLERGWQDSLVGEDGRFQVNAVTAYSVSGYFGEFDSQDVILIQSEDGRLVRRTTVVLDGQEYFLKPPSEPILPDLPHGFLHDLMIIQP